MRSGIRYVDSYIFSDLHIDGFEFVRELMQNA